MRKKVINALLALSLLVSAVGWWVEPVQASVTNDGGHVHNPQESSWTPWTSYVSKIEGKNFYLSQDLTIPANKIVRIYGNSTICLNGHKLNCLGKIFIMKDADVTICDCGTTERQGYIDSSGLWQEGTPSSGMKVCNLKGGIITGHNSNQYAIFNEGGTLHLDSVNFAGNGVDRDTFFNATLIRQSGNPDLNTNLELKRCVISGNKRQCLSALNKGSVVIDDCIISQNQSSAKGVVIFVSGDENSVTLNNTTIQDNKSLRTDREGSIVHITDRASFTMNGGSVIDNHAQKGCGIFFWNGEFKLNGSPVIKNNTNESGTCNVILNETPLQLIGPLDEGNRIGVSMWNKHEWCFTKDWNVYMPGKVPSDYFYAEEAGYIVSKNDNNEGAIVSHKHNEERFELWNDSGALPTYGNFFLDKNIRISEPIVLSSDDNVALCLNGQEVISNGQIVMKLEKGSRLTLIDCPREKKGAMSGQEAALLLETEATANSENVAVDAMSYQGEKILIKEVNPESAVGGCVVKGAEGKFELVNSGYHLEYRGGAYYIARDTYKIIYMDEGNSAFSGVMPDNAAKVHNFGVVTSLPTPIKTGYIFSGWYSDSNGSGQAITELPADTNQAVTLYAKWIAEVKAPTITKQPQSLTLTQGEEGALSIEASAEDDAQLSYQWYKASDATSMDNGAVIDGATHAILTIGKDTQVGSHNYYCIVTASRDGISESVCSDMVTVTIKTPVVPLPPPSRPTSPTEKPGETVTNPDGSVTTTITKPNGTIITITDYTNGDRLTLTTVPSGKIDVALVGAGDCLAILPAEKLDAKTVAIITDAKGVRRLEPYAVMNEKGLVLRVHDGDSVELLDKEVNFVDVSNSHWAKSSVDFVAARGLLVGVDATHFAPQMETTRAMIWSLLARLDGVTLEESTPWYKASQAWAVDTGISDGNNPNAAISREQMVTMLYRYAGSPVGSGDLSAYNDRTKVSAWAEKAMCWAVHEGLIAGNDLEYLAPQEMATRAQTAAILERFIAWKLGA